MNMGGCACTLAPAAVAIRVVCKGYTTSSVSGDSVQLMPRWHPIVGVARDAAETRAEASATTTTTLLRLLLWLLLLLQILI